MEIFLSEVVVSSKNTEERHRGEKTLRGFDRKGMMSLKGEFGFVKRNFLDVLGKLEWESYLRDNRGMSF